MATYFPTSKKKVTYILSYIKRILFKWSMLNSIRFISVTQEPQEAIIKIQKKFLVLQEE